MYRKKIMLKVNDRKSSNNPFARSEIIIIQSNNSIHKTTVVPHGYEKCKKILIPDSKKMFTVYLE